MARHAQVEQLGRITHVGEAVGQRDQEARHARLGGQGAQHADHGLFAHQLAAHDAVHHVFQFQVHAAERGQLFERQQDQVAIGQRYRLRRIMAGVDAIDAKHVALHREAQHLLVAEFVDQHGFQEAGVDDVQGVERLADGVDALAGFELHVLEQQFLVRDRHRRRNVQQIAHFLEVGPEAPLTLAAGFHRRRLQGRRDRANFRRLR